MYAPRLAQVIFLMFILLCTFSLFSQKTSKVIAGRISNESKQPVPAATVLLISPASHVLHQTITDSAGRFSFKLNVTGMYALKVTCIGYQEYQSAYVEPKDSVFMSIGLNRLTHILKDVLVQSKKKLIELNGSTLTYNVSQTITARGSSALDALKKAPGVNVDNESEITLNGKPGVLILLDGKQTYLSGKDLTDLLKSFPSGSIRSIEVMANPTAKYEASGTAGIINIKTIKSQVVGLNASITTGVSYGISAKQNEEITFNYLKNKINLYGNYSHFLGHYNYLYGTNREQVGKRYNSATTDLDDRKKKLARLGADYAINRKNVIGILLSGNYIFGGGRTDTHTDVLTTPSTVTEQTLDAYNDYYEQHTRRYNVNLNYKFEDTLGHILNIDADLGSFAKGNKNLQSNIYRNFGQSVISQNLYRTLNDIDIAMKAVKIDYASKWWRGVFEIGMKYSSVSSDNDANFFYVIDMADSLDNRRSNNFKYEERISSGYMNYKKDLGRWGFQAGLRLESTASLGTLKYLTGLGDSVTFIKRGYTNLFPSMSINFKAATGSMLSLSYARRIERPAYQDLNPFVYLLDELSFWQGNPFLKPQLVHRYTLQYAKSASTIIGLSVAQTSQFSASVTDTLQQQKIVIITKNLGTQNHFSLTLTQMMNPAKWWDATLNGLVYYIQNDVSFDQYRNLNLKRLAARFSLQQTFNLPLKLAGEIVTTYNSKRLTGANTISRPVSQVDLGLQKSVFSNKGTLRLACTDIYKGAKSRYTQNFPGFNSTSYGYFESRQIKLNFTYRFTSGAAKGPRSRNSALDSESGRIK